jgi:hypothetical protein
LERVGGCRDRATAVIEEILLRENPWLQLQGTRCVTAHRFGQRLSGRRKHARKPIGSPARRGTSACSAFRVRHSPSPALGDALNAGYVYLEVKCLGCNTHQTVALNIVRRPKSTPVHELERYMRCKDCSRLQGRPYKRSHLVALRTTKISANDPASTWWPGER